MTLTKCCLIERGLEVDGDTAVVPWGTNLDEIREGLRAHAAAAGTRGGAGSVAVRAVDRGAEPALEGGRR